MDARGLSLLLAAIILGGCVSNAPDVPPDVTPTPDATRPATIEPPTFREPLSLGWGGRAAEPSVAVAPDGTIYVAAAPQLWRSDDGVSFTALGERVCVLGDVPVCEGFELVLAPLDGFSGGDAAIRTDGEGNVYFLGLDGESGTVPFQASRDRGETWSAPFDVAGGNASDRQWLSVLENGTLLATWRDFGSNREGPNQLLLRRSLDGGASWEPARVIGPDTNIQGPLGIDPRTGAIYTPVYDDGIRVLRSLDEGRTWTSLEVTSETRDTSLRQGRPIDMFPVIDVDAAGNVYVAWAAEAPGTAAADSKDAARPRVWLAVSPDGGATWTEPLAVSPDGKVATFPWLVAGAAGRIALTWYEGRAGTPSHTAPDVWDVALVESVNADAAVPAFAGGYANTAATHVGGMCRSGGGCQQFCQPVFVCAGQDRSRSELFEMALDQAGHPLVAWVADATPPTVGIEIHVGGVADGTPLR